MTRTPLQDVTYDTIETLTLTVSQMLALQSALFDAESHNRARGWNGIANGQNELRKVITDQTEDLVAEADRKCTEWLAARELEDRKRWRREEELAEGRAAMETLDD